MRIAAEVAQHRGRPTEGRLGIDDPVGLEERVDERVPLGRIAQALGRAREIEAAACIRPAERRDKLATTHATEDVHGQEEAGVLRADPALVIR